MKRKGTIKWNRVGARSKVHHSSVPGNFIHTARRPPVHEHGSFRSCLEERGITIQNFSFECFAVGILRLKYLCVYLTIV